MFAWPCRYVQLHAGIREAHPAELDHAPRDLRVLAVVDQREMDRVQRAVRARRADRERELAQAALEQPQVGPIGDDADLQRGRQHGVRERARADRKEGNAGRTSKNRRMRRDRRLSCRPRARVHCLRLHRAPIPMQNRASAASTIVRMTASLPATTRARSSPSRTRCSRSPACAATSRAMSPRSSSTAICSDTRRTASRCSPGYLAEIEKGAMAEDGRADGRPARGPRRRRGTASGCPDRGSRCARSMPRPTMARRPGTGTVVIRRSHHIACLAAYLKRATERGLMALVYVLRSGDEERRAVRRP